MATVATVRTVPILVLTVTVAALLSGCSASAAGNGAHAQSYRSLDEFKSAYRSAGGTCPVWLEDDDIQAAAQSGTCGDGVTLSTYLSSADLLGQVKLLRDTASSDADGSDFPPRTELLIGTNWLASGLHVRQLQSKLGGQLAVINPSASN